MNGVPLRKLLSRLATGSILLAAVCLGEEPKTATDKIAVPNSTIEFTMVQLPAGKITMKDKDGKDKEVEIKPIWIGKYEVTWDEYEVFYLALDLPEKERSSVKSERLVVRARPSVPYEPPDRNW